jgi:hypothetical protein
VNDHNETPSVSIYDLDLVNMEQGEEADRQHHIRPVRTFLSFQRKSLLLVRGYITGYDFL